MNYLCVDFDPRKSGQAKSFEPLLNELKNIGGGGNWLFYGPEIKNKNLHSMERYLAYFKIGFRMFLDRKNIQNIISLQQFYGIIFAFFCRLFRVKKVTKVGVVSFIYKPKKSFYGNMYFYFINYCVNSKYIDKLYVHSTKEVEFYTDIFGLSTSKIEYLPLGIVEIECNNSQTEDFFLSAGNSNRDFDFLVNNWNQNRKLLIISGEYPTFNKDSIKSIGYSSKYIEYLSKCYAVIISLDTNEMSAGQLVILQSYMFGKPVICTKTDGICDYLVNGAAISIDKDGNELDSAIKTLLNKNIYDVYSTNCKRIFREKFTLTSMGKSIALSFKN